MADPFDILGLDAGFGLDDAQLHQQFIRRSAEHHPDRFTDPLDQADAAERAAAVNEAYRTLADPERRAGALLRLLGGSDAGDDKRLPPDLLMEMMEIREAQEEAQAAGDDARLAELAQWAREQRAGYLERIGELFTQAQALSPDQRAPVLDEIRLQLNALRYVQRMLDQLPPTGR